MPRRRERPIESEFDSKDGSLRLWALTFFGVVFESVLGTAFVYDAYSSLTYANLNCTGQGCSSPIPQYTLPLLVAYGLILIPYCWLASRSLRPKRMISPLNIQFFSIAIVIVSYTIIYVINTQSLFIPTNFRLETYFENGITITMFLGAILFMIGVFQTQAVKFLLGLNGTADDIDLKVWPVDVPFPSIAKMIDDEFLEHYDFKVVKRSNNLILLRYLSLDRRRVRVGFAPSPDNPSKSILSASGYGQGYYAIYRLDSASNLRDRIVKDFQNLLREIQPTMMNFYQTPFGQSSDSASEAVRDYSLEATEGGSSALARVRRSMLLTFGLPILILSLLAIPWLYGTISTDLFGSSVIFYIFTLITIYYPEIKERVSKTP